MTARVNIRIIAGRFVTVYPPGIAAGAFDLRNRGLALYAEITCWPRHQYHPLSTGGRETRRFASAGRTETFVQTELEGTRRLEFEERWRREIVAQRIAQANEIAKIGKIIANWTRSRLQQGRC